MFYAIFHHRVPNDSPHGESERICYGSTKWTTRPLFFCFFFHIEYMIEMKNGLFLMNKKKKFQSSCNNKGCKYWDSFIFWSTKKNSAKFKLSIVFIIPLQTLSINNFIGKKRKQSIFNNRLIELEFESERISVFLFFEENRKTLLRRKKPIARNQWNEPNYWMEECNKYCLSVAMHL